MGDQRGCRRRPVVVKNRAQDGPVLVAALLRGGAVVVLPREQRAEERRMLREELPDVAVAGAFDPVVVQAVVGLARAGRVTLQESFDVGALEPVPRERQRAN